MLFSGIKYQSIDKKSDEVIHLRVTQEMYHSGDLLNPTYNGDAYYNKPPFKMWLAQIPLHMFGESDWSYRILDSCLGIVLITLVLIFSNQVLGSIYPGFIAGFILLLSKELIGGPHGFRRGTQDTLLLVLLTASYILLWEILYDKKNYKKKEMAFCILVGLACLTKSIAGLIPLATLGFYILLTNWKLKDKLTYLSKVTLFSLLIPSTYYIYHCLKSPVAWKKFFYIELYERATKGLHNIGEPFFYLRELFVKTSFTFPILTALALSYSIFITCKKRDRRILFLLCLSILPVALFSIPNSRLPWYIFPSYVPLSLLVGYLIVNIANLALASQHKATKIFSASFLLYVLFLIAPRIVKLSDHYLKLDPTSQLTIDRLAQTVNENPSLNIYVDPSLVDTRALVGRRQSNRDSFYWTMIKDRLSKEINFENGIVVIPQSKTEEVEKYKAIAKGQEILPKSRTRKEESFIFYIEKSAG